MNFVYSFVMGFFCPEGQFEKLFFSFSFFKFDAFKLFYVKGKKNAILR